MDRISSSGNWHDRSVCVVGLGYVGLTLAVVLAESGFEVHGCEINEKILASVKKGQAHFYEKSLDARLQNVLGKGLLSVSGAMITLADVYVITVGTPLGADGRANISMVAEAVRKVTQVCGNCPLIVLRSTLKLGITEGLVKSILDEKISSYDLAFCPERTLEGKALEELVSLPQIVGGATSEATARAGKFFSKITPSVVRVKDPRTAEMIKLVDNSQRDVAFAYSNEIAKLCDKYSIDAHEVINLGKLGYARTSLFSPGPVGGPCLSKDPAILDECAKDVGMMTQLIGNSRQLNESLYDWAIDKVKQIAHLKSDKLVSVCICGVAFKGIPETDDTRGSMAIDLAKALRKQFKQIDIKGFDPLVGRREIEELGFKFSSSLSEAFAGTELLFIVNNHPMYKTIDLASLSSCMANRAVIYDYWQSQKAPQLTNGVVYTGLGF